MLQHTERLTHAVEEYLGHIRDQRLQISPKGHQLLFDVIGALQHNFNQIEGSQKESVPELESLIARALEPELLKESAPQKPPSPQVGPSEGNNSTLASSKIDHLRVKLSAMDKLLALIGELSITNNKLHKYLQDHPGPQLEAISEALSSIERDLEHTLLDARLQPISIAFRKLPRLVQELSKQSGKEAQLSIEGDHYELDKKILEALQAPLLHIVRNAIDHGIENPSIRQSLERNAAHDCRLEYCRPMASWSFKSKMMVPGLTQRNSSIEPFKKASLQNQRPKTVGATAT